MRPEWQRLSGLQRIKPGRISSSSMPFSRNFRFSPGLASSVSTSSLSRLKTSTVCCNTHMHTATREVRKDYFCIDAEIYMTGNENETEYLWLQDPLSIKKRTHPVWHHDQLLGFTNGSRFQLSKDNSTHILQTRKPTVRGNIQVNALYFANR